MGTFLEVQKILLPHKNVEKAYSFMRKAGEKGVEGVALFAGKFIDTQFEITDTIIPKQKALAIEAGLLYSVDGDELHSINVWLHQNNLRLIAQVHSHPNEAYHSATDDAYPIITTLGGISMVVPDFATRPMNINDWAIYQLHEGKDWKELKQREIENLFTIV